MAKVIRELVLTGVNQPVVPELLLLAADRSNKVVIVSSSLSEPPVINSQPTNGAAAINTFRMLFIVYWCLCAVGTVSFREFEV